MPMDATDDRPLLLLKSNRLLVPLLQADKQWMMRWRRRGDRQHRGTHLPDLGEEQMRSSRFEVDAATTPLWDAVERIHADPLLNCKAVRVGTRPLTHHEDDVTIDMFNPAVALEPLAAIVPHLLLPNDSTSTLAPLRCAYSHPELSSKLFRRARMKKTTTSDAAAAAVAAAGCAVYSSIVREDGADEDARGVAVLGGRWQQRCGDGGGSTLAGGRGDRGCWVTLAQDPTTVTVTAGGGSDDSDAAGGVGRHWWLVMRCLVRWDDCRLGCLAVIFLDVSFCGYVRLQYCLTNRFLVFGLFESPKPGWKEMNE